jgi:hypothetical protein
VTKQAGLGIRELLSEQREAILSLVERHGASNVRVFGSVARGEAQLDSDVDLLVDGLEQLSWAGGGLLADLEDLLGRKVDLVSVDDLEGAIREQVLKEAVAL